MSRPEFLNCVMTPEVIRAIRERQEEYDKNPEKAEKEQRYQRELREEAIRMDMEDEVGDE